MLHAFCGGVLLCHLPHKHPRTSPCFNYKQSKPAMASCPLARPSASPWHLFYCLSSRPCYLKSHTISLLGGGGGGGGCKIRRNGSVLTLCKPMHIDFTVLLPSILSAFLWSSQSTSSSLPKASLWIQELKYRSTKWMATLRQIPQWKPGFALQSLFSDHFLNFYT